MLDQHDRELLRELTDAQHRAAGALERVQAALVAEMTSATSLTAVIMDLVRSIEKDRLAMTELTEAMNRYARKRGWW